MKALRWIAVLPGALAASMLAQAIVALANFSLPELIVRLYNNTVGCGVFVIAGVWIAPAHREWVAGVLAGLLVIGELVALALSPSLMTGIEVVIGAATAIYACVMIVRHEQGIDPLF